MIHKNELLLLAAIGKHFLDIIDIYLGAEISLLL